jgi:hypothetical protein
MGIEKMHENNDMEGFNPELLNDKLDSIQQVQMTKLNPLKEQIAHEQDFARKGLLIIQYNELVKQLGMPESEMLNWGDDMDMAA